MKITNLGVPNTALPAQPQIEDLTLAPSDPPAASGAAAGGGYTPSFELQQLIQQVRQQPDIREGLIQAAAQRYQQGYYNTQASAEQTATAIISNND